MARQTQVRLVDDLDGSDAVTTRVIALDRTKRQLDLSEANSARLDEALAPFLSAGSPVHGESGSSRSTRRGRDSTSGVDNDAVREWARAQGIQVADRGRIARTVIEKYQAEH